MDSETDHFRHSIEAEKCSRYYWKQRFVLRNRSSLYSGIWLEINELCFTDLQNVNITLRFLFRPLPEELPRIYSSFGVDFDERILPSITNEVLKAVVVCLNSHIGKMSLKLINLFYSMGRPNLMLVS